MTNIYCHMKWHEFSDVHQNEFAPWWTVKTPSSGGFFHQKPNPIYKCTPKLIHANRTLSAHNSWLINHDSESNIWFLEFCKKWSVGNMVRTRSCQDRVHFLISSWSATSKLKKLGKTDLTAGFEQWIKTVTVADTHSFDVYRCMRKWRHVWCPKVSRHTRLTVNVIVYDS